MAVTIDTAATHKEFVTLNDLKSEMDMADESTDDALLVSIIEETRDFIVSYCGREFARESVTETKEGNAHLKLILDRTPIVSVTSVAFDGTTIGSTQYTIDDAKAGFLFREAGWTNTDIYGQAILPYSMGHGRRDWSVVYTAGYIMPGSTEGQVTLPADLRRAAKDLCKSWYYQRTDNPNVRRQQTGEANETKYTEGSGFPPHVLRVLDQYTRIV